MPDPPQTPQPDMSDLHQRATATVVETVCADYRSHISRSFAAVRQQLATRSSLACLGARQGRAYHTRTIRCYTITAYHQHTTPALPQRIQHRTATTSPIQADHMHINNQGSTLPTMNPEPPPAGLIPATSPQISPTEALRPAGEPAVPADNDPMATDPARIAGNEPQPLAASAINADSESARIADEGSRQPTASGGDSDSAAAATTATESAHSPQAPADGSEQSTATAMVTDVEQAATVAQATEPNPQAAPADPATDLICREQMETADGSQARQADSEAGLTWGANGEPMETSDTPSVDTSWQADHHQPARSRANDPWWRTRRHPQSPAGIEHGPHQGNNKPQAEGPHKQRTGARAMPTSDCLGRWVLTSKAQASIHADSDRVIVSRQGRALDVHHHNGRAKHCRHKWALDAHPRTHPCLIALTAQRDVDRHRP